LFDLSRVGLTFDEVIEFPPFIAFLILAQFGYVIWLYFYRAFGEPHLLRKFWYITFSLLIAADIGFYSLALHPLARQSFGGGGAHSVNLLVKKDGQPAVDTLLGDREGSIFLIHSTPEVYYFTEKYEYAYGRSLDNTIEFGQVLRLDKATVIGINMSELR